MRSAGRSTSIRCSVAICLKASSCAALSRSTAASRGRMSPLITALGSALLLHSHVARFKPFFRTALFAPVVTTLVAVAVVWRYLFQTRYGMVNYVLAHLGIAPLDWLGDPHLAMPTIILLAVWKNFGYNMIIFLAGLQAIPEELLDAASVDGAGRWARFRGVVLPLLTPSIFFTGVLALIDSFQVFDQIFVLVKPRPTDATITVVYFIYENGFKFFKMGYASAASWILFLIVALFTAIYFRSQSRWVHYQ